MIAKKWLYTSPNGLQDKNDVCIVSGRQGGEEDFPKVALLSLWELEPAHQIPCTQLLATFLIWFKQFLILWLRSLIKHTTNHNGSENAGYS